MKKKRFTTDQITTALKEHEAGVPAAEICRKLGIAGNTFYRWKSKYGGMDASEARRLKELEDENGKLKRLLADKLLEITAMKDVLSRKW